MNTRDDLYRQIEVISEALQRIEPHSPIPFLLKRAVKLGNMPFPQLMRAIMEETKALDAMDKMLGIEKEGKGKPKNDDDD